MQNERSVCKSVGVRPSIRAVGSFKHHDVGFAYLSELLWWGLAEGFYKDDKCGVMLHFIYFRYLSIPTESIVHREIIGTYVWTVKMT